MAIKHATEYVCDLRYKFRMMCISIDECDYVFGNNQSMLKNKTTPDHKLKKSNIISYHHVQESVA